MVLVGLNLRVCACSIQLISSPCILEHKKLTCYFTRFIRKNQPFLSKNYQNMKQKDYLAHMAKKQSQISAQTKEK